MWQDAVFADLHFAAIFALICVRRETLGLPCPPSGFPYEDGVVRPRWLDLDHPDARVRALAQGRHGRRGLPRRRERMIEMLLIALVPLLAVLMARGIGYRS